MFSRHDSLVQDSNFSCQRQNQTTKTVGTDISVFLQRKRLLLTFGFTLGNKLIEASNVLSSTCEPFLGIFEQCIELARQALRGARIADNELDRVLLVGGPTHMPALRSSLQQALGAKLDCSLDPMTVVSQAPALYASTVERTGGQASSTRHRGYAR